MDVHIAATFYALPPDVEAVDAILEREKVRVEAALRPLGEGLRRKVMAGLGLQEVRVCKSVQPYALALQAAEGALAEAALPARNLDLIIDFSTLPGDRSEYLSFAQKLAADLGAETSLNFGFKVGGCGGLHLALKNAIGLMATDDSLQSALLVAGDSPPPGSRSLLPVTVQGDAACAVVLRRGNQLGPVVLATEVLTLGHLYDAIQISRDGGSGPLVIDVDSRRIEDAVMPIYYLNFHRLVHKALERVSLKLEDIDHFIYSNVSRTDREGFIKALQLPVSRVHPGRLRDLGHTFASDLVINYTDLAREGSIHPGQTLLFASAGIGFTWGVTIARA
jgi:3-oxoacyl-[acyl-carrier-protein] synthase-3